MLFIVSVILILCSTSFARPISIDQHTEYKSEYVQSVATTVHILHLHSQGLTAKLGSADKLKPISYFIADDTVAAINASFFTHSASAIGSIKQSNQPLFISTKRRGVIGWRNSPQGVQWYFDRLALDNKGKVVSDFHDTSWWQQVDYLFEGAPLLLFNGEKQAYLVEGLNNDFVFRRYARSAICVLPNKDFVFFLVQGSDHWLYDLGYTKGMTMDELADYMLGYGCEYALNFDGGYSSSLYYAGQYHYGITSLLPPREIYNVLLISYK